MLLSERERALKKGRGVSQKKRGVTVDVRESKSIFFERESGKLTARICFNYECILSLRVLGSLDLGQRRQRQA